MLAGALVAPFAGAACGHQQGAALARIDDASRASRLAYGSVDEILEHPRGGARARALTELSLELGDRDAAVGAAWQQLDRARAELGLAWLETADARDPTIRARRRDLAAAGELAISVGDRVGNGYLVLAGASHVERPQRFADELERALRLVRELNLRSSEMRALWDRLDGRRGARLRAAMELAGHNGAGVPADVTGTPAPRLDDRALRRLGARAPGLWESRMITAARGPARDLPGSREEARAAAEALLRGDPLHVDAAVVLTMIDALDAGRCEADDDVLDDLVDLSEMSGVSPAGALARWRLRLDRCPDSVAVTLAYAHALVRAALFADAAAVIEARRGAGGFGTPAATRLADSLDLLARLSLGERPTDGAFWPEPWSPRQRARSTYWSAFTASLSGPVHVAEAATREALQPEVDAARRRSFAPRARWRGVTWQRAPAHREVTAGLQGTGLRYVAELEWATALDGEASKRARRRAAARLRISDADAARTLEACPDREDRLACEEVHRALIAYQAGELELEEVRASVEPLLRAPSAQGAWLAILDRYDARELAEIEAVLEPLADTRLGLTMEYIELRLLSALARGDADTARATLRDGGALLPASTRLWGMLAVQDLAEQPDAGPALYQALREQRWRVPYSADSAAPLGFLDPQASSQPVKGATRIARLLGGLERVTSNPDYALTLLQPLVEAVKPETAADLIAHIAIAAERAEQPDARDRALALLERAAPDSFARYHVTAWLKEQEGKAGATAAARAYAEAIRRDPGARELWVGLLRARERAGATLEARQLAEFLRGQVGRGEYQGQRLLQTLERRPVAGVGEALARAEALAADGARAYELGADGAALPLIASYASSWLLRQIEEAPDLEAARAQAELAARYADAHPDPLRDREALSWALFVAGRGADARALALAPRTSPTHEGPLAETSAAVLLGEARERGEVDDALALALLRERGGALEEPTRARLTGTSASPELHAYVCERQAMADDAAGAMAACGVAWRARVAAQGLDSTLAYLVVEHAEEVAAAAGLRGEELFNEAGRGALRTPDVWWHYYRALWHEGRGEHAEAVDAMLAARARGLPSGARLPGDGERHELAAHGPLGRGASLDRGDYSTITGFLADAGYLALQAGQLELAERYAAGALRWAGAPDETRGTWREYQLARLARARNTALIIGPALELARGDLGRDSLDGAGLYEVLERHSEGEARDAMALLRERYPDSTLVEIMAQTWFEPADFDESTLARARALLAAYPGNMLVVNATLPPLYRAGEVELVKDAVATARASAPDHPWIDQLALPEDVLGARPKTPAWIRDPADFDAELARAHERLAGDEVRRYVRVKDSVELYAPARYELGKERALFTEEPGYQVLFVRDSRASRCEGAACAQGPLDVWRARGLTIHWTRELELPAGTAIESVASGPGQLLYLLVIPSGGNLFSITSGGGIEQFERHLGLLAALREGVQPLDLVRGSQAAELLRVNSPRKTWPSDQERLTARRELAALRRRARARESNGEAAPPSGCPLSAFAREGAEALPERTQADLLLDAFLAAPTSLERRALLECAAPQAPAASRLALVSLLSESPSIHAYGRAAARAHPRQLSAESLLVLRGEPEPAVSAPDFLSRPSELPEHGLAQVIVALEPRAARALWATAVAGADERQRLSALAAAFVRGGVVEDATLREITEDPEGPARDSALGLLAVRLKNPDNVARAREVLQGVARGDDPASQTATRTLATWLASQLNAEDRALLTALARPRRPAKTKAKARPKPATPKPPTDAPAEGAPQAVKIEGAGGSAPPPSPEPARAELGTEALKDLLKDYNSALTLVRRHRARPDQLERDDDDRATRWARRALSRLKPEESPDKPREGGQRHAHDLTVGPLASLLPGSDWTYARIANPGLFTSSVTALVNRIEVDGAVGSLPIPTLVRELVKSQGWELLGPGGGLDRTRPIECASPDGLEVESFVCMAAVEDRERVLELLGRRVEGGDAGVAMPLNVGPPAGFVPAFLVITPTILRLYLDGFWDEGDEEDDELTPDKGPPPRTLRERVRTTRRMFGHTLDYYALVDVTGARAVVDRELYLFIGDRLFVFSGADVARRVIAPRFLEDGGPAAPPLEHDPAFERLAGSWTEGASLQALIRDAEFPVDDNAIALEAAIGKTGARVRYSFTDKSEVKEADLSVTYKQIVPDGAVSRVSLTISEDTRELLDSLRDELDPERRARKRRGARSKRRAAREQRRSKSLEAGLQHLPAWLLAGRDAITVAWYAGTDAQPGGRWLGVTAISPALRTAARARRVKLPAADDAVERRGPLALARRQDTLVVANDPALVEAALAKLRSQGPPARSRDQEIEGVVYGARAAEALGGMSDTLSAGDPKRMVGQIGVQLLRMIERSSFSAAWDPSTGKVAIDGGLELKLAPEGSDLAVISSWLSSGEIRNALPLPKRLPHEQYQRPRAYVLEVDDPKRFAELAVTDSPRTRARVVGPRRVEITVLPATPSGDTQSLEPRARERALRSEGRLVVGGAEFEELVTPLRERASAPAELAAKIVELVHGRMRYELNPASVDATTVLRRGAGDCTEYSVLTASLLRTAGVPAELREGMLASGGELVAHAWVAYHDGTTWREIDPTAGEAFVGSGHIELSVVDVLSLISLDKIKVVELR